MIFTHSSRSNIDREHCNFQAYSKTNHFTSDCRRGQSLVVWAINEGRQAAREVDAYLMNTSTLPVTGGVVQITQKG